MAFKIVVRGKSTAIPGVYGEIKSGVKNPSQALSYGNVCLIDTGSGAGWGGGSGINGALKNGSDAIYSFDTPQDFQSFVRGGIHWLLASPLFKPAGVGANGSTIPGVSRLWYIRAATTTAAVISYTFTGGGANGGVLIFSPNDEGLTANGVLTPPSTGELTRGYGAKFITNPLDNTTFILQVWRGTYRGTDTYSNDLDAAEVNTKPDLIVQSIPVNNISALASWMQTDPTFLQWFTFVSVTPAGTGALTSADVSGNTGYKLASGATESFASGDLTRALTYVNNLDNTFFLCDKWGTTDGPGAFNLMILAQALTAKYEKFIYVGGGTNANSFNQSTNSSFAIAKTFNSERAHIVHSEVYKAVNGVAGFRQYPSIYHAAAVLGRTCGLQPQNTVAFKDIGVDGVVHNVNENEKEAAQAAGVIVSYNDTDFGRFTVLDGINSLQKNDYLIMSNGSDAISYDQAVMRIISQINKELQLNIKIDLFGDRMSGPNRNTLNDADVITYVQNFLKQRIAKPGEDNLILSYRDVTVQTNNDVDTVFYSIVANTPIKQLVTIGTLLAN